MDGEHTRRPDDDVVDGYRETGRPGAEEDVPSLRQSPEDESDDPVPRRPRAPREIVAVPMGGGEEGDERLEPWGATSFPAPGRTARGLWASRDRVRSLDDAGPQGAIHARTIDIRDTDIERE